MKDIPYVTFGKPVKIQKAIAFTEVEHYNRKWICIRIGSYTLDDGPLLERGDSAMSQTNVENKVDMKQKVLTIIGTVLCLILTPVLIINCILIVKSFTSEEVPSVAGYLPLIVLTDSMYPQIESGDLIICHTT